MKHLLLSFTVDNDNNALVWLNHTCIYGRAFPVSHKLIHPVGHSICRQCQFYNIWFDFIECFTTTFLRAHSWLNWVDEDDDEHDEVGLKEKPEDTRYIKKITSK